MGRKEGWAGRERWAASGTGLKEEREGRERENWRVFFQTLFKLCKLNSNKHKSTMQPKDDAQALVAFKIAQNDILIIKRLNLLDKLFISLENKN
jgi:hypothetical protein